MSKELETLSAEIRTNDWHINLCPEKNGFKPYEHIVIHYKDETLSITPEQLFNKLKEIFK